MTIQNYYIKCYDRTTAITGRTFNSVKTHTQAVNVTLSCGAASIPLLRRDRSYSFHHNYTFDRTGILAVSGSGGSSPAYPGGGDAGSTDSVETKSTGISDSWDGEDCTIAYLDPRHDLIVFKRTRVTIEASQETANISSIPNYSIFTALPYVVSKTTTMETTADGVLGTLSTAVTTQTMNWVHAGGDMFHLVEQYVPQGFYSDNQDAIDPLNVGDDNHQGWLAELPPWINGHYLNYQFDRDLRAGIEGCVVSENMADQDFKPTFLISDTPIGSWCYGRDGVYFTSQEVGDGTYFSKLDGKPPPITTTGDHPRYYPIAPL